MQPFRFLIATILAGSLLIPMQAFAYVGPGLGAGTIGVILGLLGSVLLALFAFFWYPIKRVFFSKETDKEEELEELTPIKSEPHSDLVVQPEEK